MIIFNHLMGLADSKWSGIKGAVAEIVGLDIHSTPGLVKVRQALAKNSGTTVDELCKVAVAASNGYTFWFSATSGKIWARSSAGSWSLAYTTSPTSGTAGCLGAMEYNGYIYWATSSYLHRIAIANADDSWASVSANWKAFQKTDASFHPMAIQGLPKTLFIGDANQVASVDNAGTFNGNALDIQTPLRIKSMTDYEFDLLIGTYIADTVNKTKMIRWDTVSTSWSTSDTIEEVGINAFIKDDNYIYVNAGKAGNIYFYNGSTLEIYKKVSGDYTSAKYAVVHPGSVANYRGLPVFGLSNGAGNPTLQGVYVLGSYSRDYTKVLDLSWVVSPNVVADVEIGAILVVDGVLFTAWKKGSGETATYGVDKEDLTAKYADAYFETTMLFQDQRDIVKTLSKVAAYYNSLPANTGFVFSYSVNGGAYVPMTPVTNTMMNEVFSELSVPNVGSLQIEVDFIVSSNDGPTLEALAVDME